MEIKKECYERAIEVLEKCSTDNGFYAAYPGYDMVFARDAMIISLGASLVGERFKKIFKKSLITLGKAQSKLGQIPNAVDKWSTRKPHIDYQSIDSTLWWIIGHYRFKEKYKDSTLFRKHNKKINNALKWLSHQDMSEDGLLEQLPTTDWQDAFPHKYGHTINTQALYYKVLMLVGKRRLAEKIKQQTNKNDGTKLWNGDFYIPWRWKNHNNYKEQGEWFDSLGNLLAIIFELADESMAKKILWYIKKNRINKPFPIKAIYPPIRKKSNDWQDYFLDCEARTPYHYLNAGIWTFIGGFYVCALVKIGMFNEAEKQLQKIAEANMKKPIFAEWLDGKTGKVGKSGSGIDGNQGWNAGMYIVAYDSVRKKRCLI